MVTPTPQTEWIEGRGILFWIAFFFIELGAATFMVASLFGNLLAEFVGWLICALLGGGFHFVYLGHPFRFYRMLLRARTSWISRGLFFVSGFLFLGGVHMVLSVGTMSFPGLLIAADVVGFLTIIYGGFAMSYINGIPLWNSALLPVLYTVAGLWGGAEIGLTIQLHNGSPGDVAGLEQLVKVLLTIFVVIFPTYLVSAKYGSPAGRVSVKEIVRGRSWPLFWVGVILFGTALPIGVVAASVAVGLEGMPLTLLYASVVFELTGDLILRYLILKHGLYNPLVPAAEFP
jgi:formate-dependent nitrite reductase membrane component NrfD